MPVYKYKAIDKNGLVFSNRTQEKSKQALIKRLKANELTPIRISQTSFGKYNKNRSKNSSNPRNANLENIMNVASEATINQSKNKFSSSEKIRIALNTEQKITTRDIIIFTQDFYLLKKAGFNNIHALSTIISATENTSLRGILEEVLSGVESGNYMYSTFEYYSDIFPYIYITLIKVGELSGSLDESLRQAVDYMETSTKLNKKLKGILIPNIIQFVALIILMFIGSAFVVPIIQNVITTSGSTDSLPAYTIAFSNFLRTVQQTWYIPTSIIAIIIAVLAFRIKTDPKAKYRWDYFKYTMPLFGKLNYSIDFSRVANAMLLNLKNGMRIQEALDVAKNVVNNYVMLSMLETSINNIIVGESWVKPFENSGITSPMITEMLKIGMQTDLPAMMEKLVEYMNIDIDNTVSNIVKVLPQILYAIVGVLIIIVTVVVLVPCITMYMGGWLFSAAGV